MRPLPLGTSLDWNSIASLRLRARMVAEGMYAGVHRSARRGAGIEFGGHRAYSPGDDLRYLDQRSLLRHDHLLVRQFETETDRALRLIVDASASMSYQGSRAPGSKFAWVQVVAAALARIAVSSGDPVGVSFIGGANEVASLPPRSGMHSFEQICDALEGQRAVGDASSTTAAFDKALVELGSRRVRGSMVVLISDLLDLPESAPSAIAALASRGAAVSVLQVLDPDEADFPFEDSLRFQALEGPWLVETDASTREQYLAAVAAEQARWKTPLVAQGARFVSMTSADACADAVRSVVMAGAQ